MLWGLFFVRPVRRTMSSYKKLVEIAKAIGPSGVQTVTNPTSEATLANIDLNTSMGFPGFGVRERLGLTVVSGVNGKGSFGTFSGGDVTTCCAGLPSGERLQYDLTRVGVNVFIASDSATDNFEPTPGGLDPFDGARATGAHTIRISWIDSAGAEQISWQRMDGTTATAITTSGLRTDDTLNGPGVAADIIAINGLAIIQNFKPLAFGGSLLPVGEPNPAINVGGIYAGQGEFTAGVPASNMKWMIIEAGSSLSSASWLYVPTGEQQLVTTATFTGDNDTNNTTFFEFFTTIPLAGNVIWKVFRIFVDASGRNLPFEAVPVFTAGTHFEVVVSAAGSSVHQYTCQVNCWKIPDPLP